MKLKLERLRELLVDRVDESAREVASDLYDEILDALNSPRIISERALRVETSTECRELFQRALGGDDDERR